MTRRVTPLACAYPSCPPEKDEKTAQYQMSSKETRRTRCRRIAYKYKSRLMWHPAHGYGAISPLHCENPGKAP